jgi:hypothetical protein
MPVQRALLAQSAARSRAGSWISWLGVIAIVALPGSVAFPWPAYPGKSATTRVTQTALTSFQGRGSSPGAAYGPYQAAGPRGDRVVTVGLPAQA